MGLGMESRMKREFHVRFDESLGGKFPGATLLWDARCGT